MTNLAAVPEYHLTTKDLDRETQMLQSKASQWWNGLFHHWF